MTDRPEFDLAIIGGGVNGCGIARDAAGRGARVVLFEKGDLAKATSSASTKLIHGGLRYLEQYKFRLVREALEERAVLWRLAPHLIHPLRFILPHHAGLRPRWMLRLGLFLYDNLGARGGLEGATSVDLTTSPLGAPLKTRFRNAFAYTDCQTDDARLVVLNAMDARARGADIRVREAVISARRLADRWIVMSRTDAGDERAVSAKAIVNASGPWVNDTLDLASTARPSGVRLVQGSHIVTRKLYEHENAYIFQNADGRIVFVIPWEEQFTMIGTTDRDWTNSPEIIEASAEEVEYLCSAVNEYLDHEISPSDVVWTWSGVRALVDDGASEAQEATRDYVLTLDAPGDLAPVLSVYGGKITTYRRLADAALKKLKPHLPEVGQPCWTSASPLPGGDFPKEGLQDLVRALRARHPYLSPSHAARLTRTYGTCAFTVLEGATSIESMGERFCSDLTARELDYLAEHEWAQTAEDVLSRRTKLNLVATEAETEKVEAYLRGRSGANYRAGRHAPVDADAVR